MGQSGGLENEPDASSPKGDKRSHKAREAKSRHQPTDKASPAVRHDALRSSDRRPVNKGLPDDFEGFPAWRRPLDGLAYWTARLSGGGPWAHLARLLILVAAAFSLVTGMLLALMWGAHTWLHGQLPTGVVVGVPIASGLYALGHRLVRLKELRFRATRHPDTDQPIRKRAG